MINKDIFKIIEFMTCILNECKCSDMTEIKFWKILYFCEADFYEKFNRKITYIDYFKNTYGPTPSYKFIKNVLDNLEAKKNIEIRQNGKIKYYYSINNNIKYNFLKKNEVDFIKEACKKYSVMSSSKLIDLSHMDAPYLGKNKKEKIDFNLVAFRNTSMDDSDVFLDSKNVPDEVALRILDLCS